MAYGIQIFNANGTSEIFGYNVAGAHLLGSGTISNVGANATSFAVTIEGLTSTNTGTIGIAVVDSNANSFGTPVTVNRGSGSFTITNNSNGTASFNYFVFRF